MSELASGVDDALGHVTARSGHGCGPPVLLPLSRPMLVQEVEVREGLSHGPALVARGVGPVEALQGRVNVLDYLVDRRHAGHRNGRSTLPQGGGALVRPSVTMVAVALLLLVILGGFADARASTWPSVRSRATGRITGVRSVEGGAVP